MKDVLISTLRDKDLSIHKFRRAAGKLSFLLAGEVVDHLKREPVTVKTPLASAQGFKLKNQIVLVPILRSGIAMLYPFMQFFEHSTVGFVGLSRDEKTAIANLYYHKMPKVNPMNDVILLDPMIATGGSAISAIRIILESGALEEKIVFASIIAATDGIQAIKKEFPKLKMIVTQEDAELNDKKFIVPGLGDFGDRYFGTPVEE